MKVKIRPHKPMVDAGSQACISITPMKKHGRAHYMGTVILTDVEFVVHDSEHWMTGELVSESLEQFPPATVDTDLMSQVRYDLEAGRLIDAAGIDVTDGHFRAAVVVGKNCYISKDW